jgi:hydroxyacylglutathione hydrolase
MARGDAPTAALEVVRVPVLQDNYVWLARCAATGDVAVIDPAVADPVLAAANARGWRIGQIWNTHWHADHVGGNLSIKAATGATVTGPAREADRIPGLDRAVDEGDAVMLGALTAEVAFVGAHTAGHIAYLMPAVPAAFVGDALFAMGCGRLFEGTPAMLWAALRRLETLPYAAAIYCAHEYTQANGRFALSVEPDNAALVARMAAVDAARAAGEATVPTTMAAERATNPFLRAATVAELAARRAAKDAFRG